MTFVLFNEIAPISIFSGSPAKRLVPFAVPNRSRSDRAVIRVYDEHGNVMETHEQARELDAVDKATYFRRYDGKRKRVP